MNLRSYTATSRPSIHHSDDTWCPLARTWLHQLSGCSSAAREHTNTLVALRHRVVHLTTASIEAQPAQRSMQLLSVLCALCMVSPVQLLDRCNALCTWAASMCSAAARYIAAAVPGGGCRFTAQPECNSGLQACSARSFHLPLRIVQNPSLVINRKMDTSPSSALE